MLKNLTPHAVTVVDSDGATVYTLPASGEVARVETRSRWIGGVCPLGEDVMIPLYTQETWGVTGLPEQRDGVMLVVSGMVRAANPERMDLASPGELVRDADGRVVGCRGLVVN